MRAIKKFCEYVKESVVVPYNIEDDIKLNVVEWYRDNLWEFRVELLAELKEKILGKTIYIEGDKIGDKLTWSEIKWGQKENSDENDHIIINGKKIRNILKIKVKDVEYSGEIRGEIYYFQIITEDDKKYRLKKIVDEKEYKKFRKKHEAEFEKIEKEKQRKEKLRLKHLHVDPYGEESWED